MRWRSVRRDEGDSHPEAGTTADGEGTRSHVLSRNWVSKSDVSRWVRCPYAFWLLYTEQIAFADTVTDFEFRLITEGNEFQSSFEAQIPTVEPVTTRTLKRFIRKNPDIVLFQPPTLRNDARKILGRPDAIEIADGVLYPVEMKAHKDVQRLDVLELAFYWWLLEPWRTKEAEPEGTLWLRRDGQPEAVRVPLPAHRFQSLGQLLVDLRRARQMGVRPRVCGCTVCSGVSREQIIRTVGLAKDVTMIAGIGRHYGPFLESECGIATWDALLDCDPDQLSEQFRDGGYASVTPKEARRWILHAKAYRAATATLREAAEPFPIPSDYITLDLEYDEGGRIWLIGAYAVRGAERVELFCWAENDEQERRNLLQLLAFVETYRELPIVTWSGNSADIPTLHKAAARLDLETEPLVSRHIDLYADWAIDNVRLPTAGSDLGSVSAYFGTARVSAIRGGFEAVNLFRQAAATQDAQLRARLIEYNRDDLDGLVSVIEGLRAVVAPERRDSVRRASTELG